MDSSSHGRACGSVLSGLEEEEGVLHPASRALVEVVAAHRTTKLVQDVLPEPGLLPEGGLLDFALVDIGVTQAVHEGVPHPVGVLLT